MRHTLRGRSLITLVALLMACLACVVAPRAWAGGPGVWTDISGSVGSSSLVQPAAARTGAGDLVAAWITEGTSQALKVRRISPAGAAGTVATIATYDAFSDPALVCHQSSTDDVYLFAGGIDGQRTGLHAWYSQDGGTSFTYGGMVSGPGGTAYQSQTDAVWTPAGLVQTWSNPDVYIHAGLSAGGDVDMGELGSSSVYEPAFGYDAVAGRLYVVTACLATGKEGLWARPVSSATGANDDNSRRIELKR